MLRLNSLLRGFLVLFLVLVAVSAQAVTYSPLPGDDHSVVIGYYNNVAYGNSVSASGYQTAVTWPQGSGSQIMTPAAWYFSADLTKRHDIITGLTGSTLSGSYVDGNGNTVNTSQDLSQLPPG